MPAAIRTWASQRTWPCWEVRRQTGGEGTIDNNLASGRKSGYTFTYTPGEKVNGAIRSYTITAVPDQVGTTGQRRFYSDEAGEIHNNSSGPADVTSPVIQ